MLLPCWCQYRYLKISTVWHNEARQIVSIAQIIKTLLIPNQINKIIWNVTGM